MCLERCTEGMLPIQGLKVERHRRFGSLSRPGTGTLKNALVRVDKRLRYAEFVRSSKAPLDA